MWTNDKPGTSGWTVVVGHSFLVMERDSASLCVLAVSVGPTVNTLWRG